MNENIDNDHDGVREGWMNHGLEPSIEIVKISKHPSFLWKDVGKLTEFGPRVQINGLELDSGSGPISDTSTFPKAQLAPSLRITAASRLSTL